MSNPSRLVVVTGAGTGIGWSSSQDLASRGYGVIAGVLNEAERDDVAARGVDGVTPIVLDVTDDDDIAAVAERVAESDGQLVGLVNSAGIVVAGPLEVLPEEDLRRQFDVNFFGLFAVTQALLPLLRASRGRVVNVGSVGGRLAFAHTGAYCASKFAVRGATDSLRIELMSSGVRVALVEPGPIATPLWERSIADGKRRREDLDPRALALYGADLEAVIEASRKTGEAGIPASRVARAIRHALLSRRPRAYYLVGSSARIQAFLGRYVPAWISDRVVRSALGLSSDNTSQ